ncbi:flavo protein [Stipitochalara longipes BDJ]|nr:flavo protein [Stipitochalara longipes BDJ]
MTTETQISIAVIVCSTRKPRICPQVASFVLDTIKTSATSKESIIFSTIDLLDWKLPLFDESVIPAHLTSSSAYDHEHTRRWSAEIARHQAFIFVTPQYNWGYPASIKNAIDYLYHEWVGKPAMIVSYGGYGGGKAAEQLKQVLQGLKMKPAETMPALVYASAEERKKAFAGQQMDLTHWGGEKEVLLKAYGELVQLLEMH